MTTILNVTDIPSGSPTQLLGIDSNDKLRTTPLTSLGIALLGDSTAVEAQETLNLVKATSDLDQTAGSVLRLGSFGLGSASPPLVSDIDSIELMTGIYRVSSTATTGTFPVTPQTGNLIVLKPNSGSIIQIFIVTGGSGSNAGRLHHRSYWVSSSIWMDWNTVYGNRNVIGTVSQSSGVPTGAILEEGSSSNGNFIRYTSGTMVCYRTMTSSSSANTTWTFPSSFVSGSTPSVTGSSVNSVSSSVVLSSSPSNTSASFSVYNSSNSRVSVSTHLLAIGKWI